MLVRELLREMRAYGWSCVRIKGSHGQWVAPDGSARITVTMNHPAASTCKVVLRAWQAWKQRRVAA